MPVIIIGENSSAAMDMMSADSTENSSSCPETLDNFNNTITEFGALLTPTGNSIYWHERTAAFYAFFYIMLVIFGVLFLALAVICLLLLAKRHLAQRFSKVRTFIAIDISLIILGFSRVFFLILDPWGQSGFCQGHIVCRVLSRLSGALAFPSLTASYTLVFITLWMSARIQLGRSSYQRFKVLFPLCFIHYLVAIVFEIVGLIPWSADGAANVVMYLLIACEAIFSVWGFLVCFAYLFAGYRLLHSIEKSARQSSMICKDSPGLTRHQLIEKSKFKNQKHRARTGSNMKLKDMVKEHHRRAIRKVSIIMYLTVVLGMTYSALSLIYLILIVLTLFDGCPGFLRDTEPQQPGVWLFLRYVFFSIEYLLALLLTYSIADYRPVFIFLRNATCCKIGDISSDLRRPSTNGLNSSSVQTLNTPSTPTSVRNGSPTMKTVKFNFDAINNLNSNSNKPDLDSEEKQSGEKRSIHSLSREKSHSASPPPSTHVPTVPSPLTTSQLTSPNS